MIETTAQYAFTDLVDVHVCSCDSKGGVSQVIHNLFTPAQLCNVLKFVVIFLAFMIPLYGTFARSLSMRKYFLDVLIEYQCLDIKIKITIHCWMNIQILEKVVFECRLALSYSNTCSLNIGH